MSMAELATYPNTPEEKADVAFHERLQKEPIDFLEKCTRPHSGIVNSDDVDESDMCFQFSRDIHTMWRAYLFAPGSPITKDYLAKMPKAAGVYWLNARLADNQYRLVYVGKSSDLYHRWNDQKHHHYERALEWNCYLNWWEMDRGTESLIEAAMIYFLKPSWNERQ